MKYKIISILYKPVKYIFTNIIYLIKLASAIITILSLFNISLIYYDFDIINYINDLINKIMNYIKVLYNKWINNEEDEIIPEPTDYLSYRNNPKIIDKTIQNSNNESYWIIPLMIISGIAIYYFNPQTDINNILEPVLKKTDKIVNIQNPEVFITGIFTYKFLIVAISYITGYDLNIFDGDDNNDEDSNNNKGLFSNEEREELKNFINKNETTPDNTPKASTSQLPNVTYPINENPFNKFKPWPIKESEIKKENWV